MSTYKTHVYRPTWRERLALFFLPMRMSEDRATGLRIWYKVWRGLVYVLREDLGRLAP